LLAWQSGMRQPLPIAVKTAFAWLGQTEPVKAEAAARKAYEGDGVNTDGERRESVALARQFADYDALTADETFVDWCSALYRPLLRGALALVVQRGGALMTGKTPLALAFRCAAVN
jgi:exodeoxyribonuclease V gamma subunit